MRMQKHPSDSVTLQEFMEWKTRNSLLKKLPRWGKFLNVPMPTSLSDHYLIGLSALNLIINELAEALGCHPDFLRLSWCIHDDPELITGDIPGNLKLWENDNAQLSLFVTREQDAVTKLMQYYPKRIAGFSTEQILLDHIDPETRKNNPVNQLICYFDKFIVGKFEVILQLFHGDIRFLEPLEDYSLRMAHGVLASQDWAEKYKDILFLWKNPNIKDHPFFDLTNHKGKGIYLPTGSSLEVFSLLKTPPQKWPENTWPWLRYMITAMHIGYGKNAIPWLTDPRKHPLANKSKSDMLEE